MLMINSFLCSLYHLPILDLSSVTKILYNRECYISNIISNNLKLSFISFNEKIYIFFFRFLNLFNSTHSLVLISI